MRLWFWLRRQLRLRLRLRLRRDRPVPRCRCPSRCSCDCGGGFPRKLWRLPLLDGQRARGANGEAETRTVAQFLAHYPGLTVHELDGALGARGHAESTPVTLLLVDPDDLSYGHIRPSLRGPLPVLPFHGRAIVTGCLRPEGAESLLCNIGFSRADVAGSEALFRRTAFARLRSPGCARRTALAGLRRRTAPSDRAVGLRARGGATHPWHHLS